MFMPIISFSNKNIVLIKLTAEIFGSTATTYLDKTKLLNNFYSI